MSAAENARLFLGPWGRVLNEALPLPLRIAL